jgi:catechol 2,3-dioxygenase-like lactoylglutathione lyase family enzyme
MNVSVSHTFVFVDDGDKALSFYRDVLGLQLRIGTCSVTCAG